MDADELQLFKIVGKRECFRVPEGYFSQLAERVGDRLPQAPMPRRSFSLQLRRHRILAAATVAAVVALTSALWFGSHLASRQEQVSMSPSTPAVGHESHSDHLLDECADFAMLDNDDIYSYLDENER